MYVILVYDMGEDRVVKMLKLCRQYLHWIQNSVFEGHLTPLQLKELKHEIQQLMLPQHDSVIIFTNNNVKWMNKEVLGIDRESTSMFL